MAVLVNKLDPEFKYEVAAQPGGENIKSCFACGVCTGGCPISERDENFDPRKIIRMVLLGMKKRVLSSDFIWYCLHCNTCSFHCPQDVRFADIMNVLQDMAVKEGYVHSSFPKQIRKIGELSLDLRRAMILEVVPKKSQEVSIDPKELLDKVRGKV